MVSIAQDDLAGAYEEDAYQFQQWQPIGLDEAVGDKESVSETSQRTRRDAQGNVEYQYDDGEWVPAYYHVNLRARLLNDAGGRGTYDFKRAGGKGLLDKTSYLDSQKTWGFSRANRPRILYMYEKPAGYQGRQGDVPYMYRYGRLVLSIDDQPILDYPDIPDVLSSRLEGHIMEAIMRLDRRVIIEDFRARMPSAVTVGAGQCQKTLSDANTFASRMRRFRTSTFNIVWSVDRGGSKEMKQLFDSLLSPTCKATNSTRNWHDLYPHEKVLQEMLSFGMYLERAGKSRGRTEEEREAAFQKLFGKFDKSYVDFKRDQQELAISGRNRMHLVDGAYHQAVEGWLSSIQAQRIAKGKGLTIVKGPAKRELDTALEDDSDGECIDNPVERTGKNRPKMIFGPPIEESSSMRANLTLGPSHGDKTMISAFGRFNGDLTSQHMLQSGKESSSTNHQVLAKPNTRKRKIEDSKDIDLQYPYGSPQEPSLQVKRQRTESTSGNNQILSIGDDELPPSSQHTAHGGQYLVYPQSTSNPPRRHNHTAPFTAMGKYNPDDAAEMGDSKGNRPRVPDSNSSSKLQVRRRDSHARMRDPTSEHVPPDELYSEAVPMYVSKLVQPLVTGQEERMPRLQACNLAPGHYKLAPGMDPNTIQGQQYPTTVSGTPLHHPLTIPYSDTNYPVPPPAYPVGRRRSESKVPTSQARKRKRASNMPNAGLAAGSLNYSEDDECSLEIASPGEAARISAKMRSRKYDYPVESYPPDTPNSYLKITHESRSTDLRDSVGTGKSCTKDVLSVHMPKLASSVQSTTSTRQQLVDATEPTYDNMSVFDKQYGHPQDRDYSSTQISAAQKGLVTQIMHCIPVEKAFSTTESSNSGVNPPNMVLGSPFQSKPAPTKNDPQTSTPSVISRVSPKSEKKRRSFEEWLELDGK